MGRNSMSINDEEAMGRSPAPSAGSDVDMKNLLGYLN
jgi:hypothetical protein